MYVVVCRRQAQTNSGDRPEGLTPKLGSTQIACYVRKWIVMELSDLTAQLASIIDEAQL